MVNTERVLPVLVVHGGAGRIPGEARPARARGIARALDAGWAVLARGGSAVDAVVAAVAVLEDDPHFNAGRGSSLTRAGTVEMDAGLMEGHGLNVGAVAHVRRVANPIRLAREVLLHSPHILLVGEGAEDFGKARGLSLVPPESLITERARQALARYLERHEQPAVSDTVGAVALDVEGHLAAGTSTGGMLGKVPGRVGDVPLVGCGFYADETLGACSATGIGESIARALLSYRAVEGLGTREPARAAEEALDYMTQRIGGKAGLILLSADGRPAARWNTQHMSWGFRTPDEERVVG